MPSDSMPDWVFAAICFHSADLPDLEEKTCVHCTSEMAESSCDAPTGPSGAAGEPTD